MKTYIFFIFLLLVGCDSDVDKCAKAFIKSVGPTGDSRTDAEVEWKGRMTCMESAAKKN